MHSASEGEGKTQTNIHILELHGQTTCDKLVTCASLDVFSKTLSQGVFLSLMSSQLLAIATFQLVDCFSFFFFKKVKRILVLREERRVKRGLVPPRKATMSLNSDLRKQQNPTHRGVFWLNLRFMVVSFSGAQ